MKPILSLSTSWCSHRHTDGYAMLLEMADLGFDHVELSHGIRIPLVPGILKAVEEGMVQISSIHNFCPLPTGVSHAAPNLFEPSAKDFREHDQWVRHTRRSIDFAAQIGAKVLVCHLGSVQFFWLNPGRALRRYPHRHPDAVLSTDEKYQKLLLKSVKKIRSRMGPFWERTQASVREILDYAKEKGVTLGFENREKFEELPLDEDYPAWMETFPREAPVGYWHDTGHADIKEKMGRLNHRAHLQAMAPRLVGFHLHDVNAEGEDHQGIGDGHIDFNMVSEFWQGDHRLILEFNPRLSVDVVQRSRERALALMKG